MVLASSFLNCAHAKTNNTNSTDNTQTFSVLTAPWGVAIDDSGNIYVTDFYNNFAEKFGASGEFITKWGTHGLGDGQFAGPCGIAVDENNNVYVVDKDNSRVEKFSSSGAFLFSFGNTNSIAEPTVAPSESTSNSQSPESVLTPTPFTATTFPSPSIPEFPSLLIALILVFGISLMMGKYPRRKEDEQ